jgi:hypothetical protein
MAFLMIDGPLRALNEPARLVLAERQVAMVERGLLADAVA